MVNPMTTPATHADLRAALEFYATYWCGENNATPSASLLHDMGERARKALAALALPGDEVRLRVRWEGDALMVGNVKLGSVWPSRIHDNEWAYRQTQNEQPLWADTRDAAREALVKAVGGEG